MSLGRAASIPRTRVEAAAHQPRPPHTPQIARAMARITGIRDAVGRHITGTGGLVVTDHDRAPRRSRRASTRRPTSSPRTRRTTPRWPSCTRSTSSRSSRRCRFRVSAARRRRQNRRRCCTSRSSDARISELRFQNSDSVQIRDLAERSGPAGDRRPFLFDFVFVSSVRLQPDRRRFD